MFIILAATSVEVFIGVVGYTSPNFSTHRSVKRVCVGNCAQVVCVLQTTSCLSNCLRIMTIHTGKAHRCLEPRSWHCYPLLANVTLSAVMLWSFPTSAFFLVLLCCFHFACFLGSDQRGDGNGNVGKGRGVLAGGNGQKGDLCAFWYRRWI